MLAMSAFAISKGRTQVTHQNPEDESELFGPFSEPSNSFAPLEENENAAAASIASSRRTLQAEHPPDVQLSNWHPSDATCKRVTNIPRRFWLKLERYEYVTLIGYYSLHVVTGTVEIYGALIQSGTSQHIYAPSSHPLPSVVSGPCGAQVEISEVSENIGRLIRSSPSFRSLWAGIPISQLQANGQEALQGTTFAYVGGCNPVH